MPVIKHYDGVCHVYAHADADPEMTLNVILNSKCQKPGVCNAAETVLVHEAQASTLLPRLGAALATAGVELRADATALAYLPSGSKEATEEDWRAEYLDLILSIKVVASLQEAISHINAYGSHHTDTIMTGSQADAESFMHQVDSAVVMWNASTRFNDGGEFGFGAEIGISTDKLHARGPMGLAELTSYKYLVYGHGQVRS
jgi:glutamate-5-semialdehyde dehydrogenase